MKTLLNLFALAVLAAAGAHADISITLDDPNQIGVPGETLSFYGVIANTDPTLSDAAIYLNSYNFNFTLTDASTTVSDNFFAFVPISLGPGTSSGDIDLFDITLANPETDPLGLYGGTYGLVGGADGGDDSGSDNLAQASFSVYVPEPSILTLLAAMLGVAMLGVSLALHGGRRTASVRK